MREDDGVVTEFTIVDVYAREVLDSRGNPTVEATVELAGGAVGKAMVPSGASTGSREALELRDGGARYRGKGVGKAVDNVKGPIADAVLGMDARNQQAVDLAMLELDGTENKEEMGANAILAVSLATARAAAEQAGLPLYWYLGGCCARILPVPLMNVINGGVHADNPLDFQEFMIVPAGFDSFPEALRAGSEVYHTLKGILKERGLSVSVGDEGGFAPAVGSPQEALDLLVAAIEKAGYRPGEEVGLALDVAASELWDEDSGAYRLPGMGMDSVDSDGLIDLLEKLLDAYPIVSVEDGLGEGDWHGWRRMTERLGDRVQLVGDDVFVTNQEIVANAVRDGVANALLVKPNQVGTLSETVAAASIAAGASYGVVVSHRSGETEDAFIADLAVALGCGQIKTGAPCRSERVAKYNRLLAIHDELGSAAHFASWGAFRVGGRGA